MTEQELQSLLVAERDWRITELEFCKKIPFPIYLPFFQISLPFVLEILYSHDLFALGRILCRINETIS